MRIKESNIRNKIWIIGIIWVMVNIFSFHSYAKTSFLKQQPVGVMSTAVGKEIAVSWEPVQGADGYEIFEAMEKDSATSGNAAAVAGQLSANAGFCYLRIKSVKACKTVLKNKEPGATYYYYVRAYQNLKNGRKRYSKSSKKVSTTVAVKGVSTIKNLLQTALAPMGSTMYVWGGGWNKADTGAGKEAKQIGVSPAWRAFAKNKKASYNYRNYRYQIHNGLDCSGYVGWCIYNVLNTSNNKRGYVYSASQQARKFAELGFGSYRSSKKIRNYCAGDIMSSTCNCCGHVWIVVGECKDGSVVLLHSSPAGVQLSGTVTPQGKKNSQAYRLAKKYMKKYYKAWYKKYPEVSRGITYLSHYSQMRWRVTGKQVTLSDPDGYQSMSAEKVLKDLFQ